MLGVASAGPPRSEANDAVAGPAVFTLGAEAGGVLFVLNPSLSDRTSPARPGVFDSEWTTMTSGGWQLPVTWGRAPEPRR